MTAKNKNLKRPQLRQELLARAQRDQQARKKYLATQVSSDGETIMHIDASNTARMEQIVSEVGWPDEEMVGPDGAKAAWLLVQHANRNPAFQERSLPLLYDAVQRGTATKKQYAYLWDRIAVHNSRPQRYGTQFDAKLNPHPIEDEANIDQYRKSMGLGTMQEAIADIQRKYSNL